MAPPAIVRAALLAVSRSRYRLFKNRAATKVVSWLTVATRDLPIHDGGRAPRLQLPSALDAMARTGADRTP